MEKLYHINNIIEITTCVTLHEHSLLILKKDLVTEMYFISIRSMRPSTFHFGLRFTLDNKLPI